MKQFIKRWPFVALVFFPASAWANPISDNPYGAKEARGICLALFCEVLVVALLVDACKLRMLRLIFTWFCVNLATFYLLLQPILILTQHNIFVAELTVIFVEAGLLIGLGRWHFIQRPGSAGISARRALWASVAGNIVSLFLYPALMDIWI